MECQHLEEHLIEYIDRSLPAKEMAQIAEHLHDCSRCSDLFDDVRSVLDTCHSVPTLPLDLELLEKILLRTSGRPRTRTFRELASQYFLRPILTPRFAVGASLGMLFLALTIHLMVPKVSAVASVVSPKEIFRQMDRVTHQIYSEGLKLYDKKNEWQAQFTFFKNNLFNKVDYNIEQLDVPVQSKEKTGEPGQQQEKAPDKKSSVLLLPA